MIAIRIRTNIEDVAGKVAKLPNRLNRGAEDIGKEWGQWVVKAAKRRAPVVTGNLRKNIQLKPKTKKTWEVGIYGSASRYGAFVEQGMYPKQAIPVEYIDQHMSNPGQKGIPTNQLGEGNARGWFRPKASSKKGFLAKSLQVSKNYIPKIVTRAMANRLRR